MNQLITDHVRILSLSTYFKQIVQQLYKVILILDKFFLKYEGGVKLIPPPSQAELPSKNPALLGFIRVKRPLVLKVYFLRLNMCLYLRIKFQVSNVTLTSYFRQRGGGGGANLTLPPSPQQNEPLKSPARLGLSLFTKHFGMQYLKIFMNIFL